MLGYEVTVEGEYIARSPLVTGEKILKNYSITVNLPTMKNALSVVKNRLLETALKQTYSDYLSWRTHVITKVTPKDEASALAFKNVDVQYMDRDGLLSYIAANALGVDHTLFPDLSKLRDAVIRAKEDPAGFAKKMERHRGELETDRAIAAANPKYFKSVSLQGKKSNEPLIQGSYPRPKEGTIGGSVPGRDLSPEAMAEKTENRVAGLAREMIKEGELEASGEEL